MRIKYRKYRTNDRFVGYVLWMFHNTNPEAIYVRHENDMPKSNEERLAQWRFKYYNNLTPGITIWKT